MFRQNVKVFKVLSFSRWKNWLREHKFSLFVLHLSALTANVQYISVQILIFPCELHREDIRDETSQINRYIFEFCIISSKHIKLNCIKLIEKNFFQHVRNFSSINYKCLMQWFSTFRVSPDNLSEVKSSSKLPKDF